MPATPTNVLFITTDQQHWQTLGLNNPRIRTPNLDHLAREGVNFTRAYCANPVCSPSRATMLTGLYPSWHHCWTIGVKLPEDAPTINDVWHAAGYETALIGKAHLQPLNSTPDSLSIECQPVMRDLDFWRGFHGPWYGFDHIELARNHADESHAGQHYALWLEAQGLHNWRDYFQPWPPTGQASGPRYSRYWMRERTAWDLPAELHYNTWTAERTIAVLEGSVTRERPFFLWSSFLDPHPPCLVPEPWASMYDLEEMQPGALLPGELEQLPPHFGLTQKEHPDFGYCTEGHAPHGVGSHCIDAAELRRYMAAYYGMVSFVDEQVGRILAALERLGLAENTLVVFTTDHGHFLGQHGLIDKGPFHYEDLLRIPMIARLPGVLPAGRTVAALQSQVDLPPTMLAAAGLDAPGLMQGRDQMPAWRGEVEAVRDHVVVENRMTPTRMVLRTLVTATHKLTIYRGQTYGELFDLAADPQERHNLWDSPEHAPLKAELLWRLCQAELEREPTRMQRIAGA